MGAAGTKMPTTRVPAYRCGTDWSGWLDGAHPTVQDGEVQMKVSLSNRLSELPVCKYSTTIFVKNCGSYFIFTTHLVVIHATVVQTECEAIIHGAVRGLINRSVTTCV